MFILCGVALTHARHSISPTRRSRRDFVRYNIPYNGSPVACDERLSDDRRPSLQRTRHVTLPSSRRHGTRTPNVPVFTSDNDFYDNGGINAVRLLSRRTAAPPPRPLDMMIRYCVCLYDCCAVLYIPPAVRCKSFRVPPHASVRYMYNKLLL